MNKPKTILYTLGLILMIGCTQEKGQSEDPMAHRQEIDEWHAKRERSLKSDDGWLNLAGLYWLNEGFNTFGSATTNDIVFPEGKIAANAGTFMVQNGRVTIEASKDVEIRMDTTVISRALIHVPDSSFYPVLSHGSLKWLVISRSGKLGVRLRDLESEAVANFKGVDRYPVDLSWRLKASFERYDPVKQIDITNILGQTYQQPCPGALVFEINGATYRLDAIDEGGDEYFVIFGDKTNEHETYPSGRYMYVSLPDADNMVTVDFNKAYNPPCAFTAYATCPLPPRQNILDVAIEAGEKNFGTH